MDKEQAVFLNVLGIEEEIKAVPKLGEPNSDLGQIATDYWSLLKRIINGDYSTPVPPPAMGINVREWREREIRSREETEWKGRARKLAHIFDDLLSAIEKAQGKQVLQRSGCPCLYTEPCDPQCSCVNPNMSHDCSRCATHGSSEQRQKNAERLAAVIDSQGEQYVVVEYSKDDAFVVDCQTKKIIFFRPGRSIVPKVQAKAKADELNGEVKRENYYAEPTTGEPAWVIYRRDDMHDVKIGYAIGEDDRDEILNALNKEVDDGN